jgi:PAS domain-containing protein
MAIDQKTPVIVSDISQDVRWDNFEWCRLALAVGLRSCWTTPILSQGGKPLGTFAIYQHEVGSPTPLQTDLIAQFTHIASIAIERAQAEETLRHSDDELRQSEAFLTEAQRLSSTGSFAWRVAKGEIIWSEQTYRIYEIDPSLPATFDLVGTRIHPEEASWFQELLGRASDEGRDLEFEHRLQMPDHSIKYLHVVAHATRDHDGQLEYIGAVQVVTERRRSEDALNKLRSDLAHMGRLTTLGALTASIAHEVNQPLSGIITNASTSLLMLDDHPPDIDGARESAQRTIRDANRASEVIARLRALFKKTSTSSDSLDLSEARRSAIHEGDSHDTGSRPDVHDQRGKGPGTGRFRNLRPVLASRQQRARGRRHLPRRQLTQRLLQVGRRAARVHRPRCVCTRSSWTGSIRR